MDASKKTINDIFNGNRILEIPFFQRAYVWGEKQWERLLEDMEAVSKTNKPYFLGSVILKQQPTSSGSKVGDIRTLIDGQQRLTTLNIFFKVLCLKSGKSAMFDRTFRLMTDELALSHSHNDIDKFNEVLSINDLVDLPGEDNITKCYGYFKKSINVDNLDFQKILANILFVGIDLDPNEDEQQIFDTINSLGVTLTTAELLKNYFFNRDIKLYEKYWKNLFEKNEDVKKYWDREITAGRVKRTFIDLFFDAFLQIKIQDKSFGVKTEDKIAYARGEHLFESYKDFIKNYLDGNNNTLLDEIKEYAEIFAKNFDYEIINREISSSNHIERLNAIIFGLDNSTLISYVLYVLKNVSNSVEQDNIFQFLESYIMRRMVAHTTNKNYNQLFTERFIGNKILTVQGIKAFIEKSTDTSTFIPTNEEVSEGFNKSILINKQSAGILYLLESKHRKSHLHSTALLGINKYSLEHLMPKNWSKNWGTLPTQDDTIKRNRKLLTLGNLTIITQSLNSSIRDSDWQTKKEGKGDKKGLEDYASGLETMNKYLTLSIWDENAINTRAKDLYEIAEKVWAI